jgi:hypothetical protein
MGLRVYDYHTKMKIFMNRANVLENMETIMMRFFNGLDHDIANIIQLQHYVELEDTVYKANKVERQVKCKSNT